MRVLVTGGAGYIGSHAVLELLKAGHQVVTFDNYCNSSPESLRRVSALAGAPVDMREGDIRDAAALKTLLKHGGFGAVLHFAGLKAVGESVEKPDLYRENNTGGSRNLLEAMQGSDCRRLVFSSSCTVYGEVKANPVDESHPRAAVNPYGQTKLDIETLCFARAKMDPSWKIALLRYFNPIGAHESGRIGEDPKGIPNNLLPFVMQTAAGRREKVRVWGRDYPTPDGTCIRDYIHVVDLARGHLAALDRLDSFAGAEAVNLGTGKGSSVLEVIHAAAKAVGRPIPYEIAPRRPGDAPAIWANPALAKEKLGWTAERNLDAMCADHWRWQKDNPDGYGC